MSSYIRLQQIRKNRQIAQRKAYYKKMFIKKQKLELEKFNKIHKENSSKQEPVSDVKTDIFQTESNKDMEVLEKSLDEIRQLRKKLLDEKNDITKNVKIDSERDKNEEKAYKVLIKNLDKMYKDIKFGKNIKLLIDKKK